MKISVALVSKDEDHGCSIGTVRLSNLPPFAEIRELGLRLHPGDWFSQNVALGIHLALSDLQPDLMVIDHSASCVPLLKWRFPDAKVLFYCHFPQQLVTPSRFFLYRCVSRCVLICSPTQVLQLVRAIDRHHRREAL